MKKLLSAACAALFVLLALFSPEYLRLSRETPETPGVREQRLKTVVIWQTGTIVKSGGEILRRIAAFEKGKSGTRVFLRSAGASELSGSRVMPDIYLFTPECAPPKALLSGAPLPYYSEFYSLVYRKDALSDERFSLEKLMEACPQDGFCALARDFSALPLALLGCKCPYKLYSNAYAVKKALTEGEAYFAVLPDGEASVFISENERFALEILPPATERTVYIGLSPSASEEAQRLAAYLLSEDAADGFRERNLCFHGGSAGSAVLTDPFTFPAEKDAQLARALSALLSGDADGAASIWGIGGAD
jgi:hypothetical protein